MCVWSISWRPLAFILVSAFILCFLSFFSSLDTQSLYTKLQLLLALYRISAEWITNPSLMVFRISARTVRTVSNNPDVKLEACHANIKGTQPNVACDLLMSTRTTPAVLHTGSASSAFRCWAAYPRCSLLKTHSIMWFLCTLMAGKSFGNLPGVYNC